MTIKMTTDFSTFDCQSFPAELAREFRGAPSCILSAVAGSTIVTIGAPSVAVTGLVQRAGAGTSGLPNLASVTFAGTTVSTPSSGLSVGAIIGIVVGALILVALIVVIIVVAVVWHRRRAGHHRVSQGAYSPLMETQIGVSQPAAAAGKHTSMSASRILFRVTQDWYMQKENVLAARTGDIVFVLHEDVHNMPTCPPRN